MQESNKDFSEWIDSEVNSRKELLKHLEKNESILPSLFQKNMVNDLFYNVIQDEAKLTATEENKFK